MVATPVLNAGEKSPVQRGHDYALSPNLDTLRAVAVMCVYFSHLFGFLTTWSVYRLGSFGVVIFFVHTSYVLMGSLERLAKTASRKRTLVLQFWIRRLFRIYPLSILFVVTTLIFRIPITPQFPYVRYGTGTIFANLTLTQNVFKSISLLSPMWTLAIEVQMYVLLPFLFLITRKAWRYRAALLWSGTVLLAIVAPHLGITFDLFPWAPCFAAGILSYGIVSTRKGKAMLGGWTWPLVILILIALFRPFYAERHHQMSAAWICALLLGLVYANTQEHAWKYVQAPIHWIAEHSYGIYLGHMVIFWVIFIRMASSPMWMKSTLLVLFSVGLPAILYATIERPLIRVGAKLAAAIDQNE